MSHQKFKQRPLTLDDATQFVETYKAVSADAGTHRVYQPEFIQHQWQEPNFNISSSSLGIFTDDDRLIAYTVLWDAHDVPVHPWVEWAVHPDFRQYDLDIELLNWVEKTSQRVIDRCPPSARISLQSGAIQGYQPAEVPLKRAGYHPIRYSYEMRIDMDSQPIQPVMPAGLTIRTYRHDADLFGFVTAFQDSFSDHFGYVAEPFEKEVREFRHWFETDKTFDPTLVFLAVDEQTNEIAGYILGLNEEAGDPSVAHIELVGVKRAYRRRGLAQAMLYHAFNEFWNRDRKSVTLGVDADSLTNAVKLYERVGMYIFRQYVRYEKVIREGQELATVMVE